MNALTQSAIDQALRIGGPEVELRRRSVIAQRTRLLDALRDMPVEPCDSQANFVWLKARDLSGTELAARLRRDGVLVAPGGPLGAADHVRITVRNASANDRLLAALEKAFGA